MSSRSSSIAKRAKVIPADAVSPHLPDTDPLADGSTADLHPGALSTDNLGPSSSEPALQIAAKVIPAVAVSPHQLNTEPLAGSSTTAFHPGALSTDNLGPSSTDPAVQIAALETGEELDGSSAPVDLVCRPKCEPLSSAPVTGMVADQHAAAPKQDLMAAVPAPAIGGNRARFLSGMQPSKVSCDLSMTPVSPGLRFSFEAIVVVVYPASTTPPERRYIEVMDQHGTTGITVWNQNAHVLGRDAVGCVVKFTRLSLTMHNGKKNLTMSKDSTMHLEQPSFDSMLMSWWRNLLHAPIVNSIQFHDTPALSVVNISGILGQIHVEEKIVKGETKNLLVLILTDRTGKVEVRSWNHSDTEFKRFQERAVLLKRVRVCIYAGTRTGELLTGTNGTTVTTDFDHQDLDKYWQE